MSNDALNEIASTTDGMLNLHQKSLYSGAAGSQVGNYKIAE